MPKMNHTGPEGRGPMTGRKLGFCMDSEQMQETLFGKGMGKRRKMGGGKGLGKRLKYDESNRSE